MGIPAGDARGGKIGRYPVCYVELGHEQYLQRDELVSAFPDVESYARTANTWARAIKGCFPNATVAACGAATLDPLPAAQPIVAACAGLPGLVDRTVIGALTVHRYWDAAAAPTTSQGAAGLISQVLDEMGTRSIAGPASCDQIPTWFTEWNIDTRSSDGAGLPDLGGIGGTWTHELATSVAVLSLLAAPQVKLATAHSSVGASVVSTCSP